jgi:hypothetical protein
MWTRELKEFVRINMISKEGEELRCEFKVSLVLVLQLVNTIKEEYKERNVLRFYLAIVVMHYFINM